MRIGVLATGSGTNFQALVDACRSGYAPAEVVAVLTNKADALVLDRAARAGVPGVFVDPKAAPTREEYDRMLLEQLKLHGVELVCNAGYMRILSSEFVSEYRDRALNIHPSLLPSFPGLHAVRQALEHGVRVTGVTVHVVTDDLDGGPVLLQRAVDVLAGEPVESLTSRLHLVEYALYPKALKLWASGMVRVDGRRVEVSGDVEDPPWAGSLPPGLRSA
ncbi:MAG TPA: phosphoribosylglycinamide formyltransferase [Actinomycetota bacterium]|nr:phosphoribosylglycinamide formyltransferase [Actinomycetota bacterium]